MDIEIDIMKWQTGPREEDDKYIVGETVTSGHYVTFTSKVDSLQVINGRLRVYLDREEAYEIHEDPFHDDGIKICPGCGADLKENNLTVSTLQYYGTGAWIEEDGALRISDNEHYCDCEIEKITCDKCGHEFSEEDFKELVWP